jgi:hypothetical protein
LDNQRLKGSEKMRRFNIVLNDGSRIKSIGGDSFEAIALAMSRFNFEAFEVRSIKGRV